MEINMQKVYGSQGYGNKGKKCILEIYVDAGREFTEEEKRAFRDAAELIQNAVNQANYRLDDEYKQQGEADTQKLIDLFGDSKIFVEKIPNGYWADDCHNPWLIVTTDKGRIKLGWRKRVINIDWSESTIATKSNDLFPEEDVTKDDKFIHAWGYEKAQEYINVLLQKEPVLS
jgi:hypothetical protein